MSPSLPRESARLSPTLCIAVELQAFETVPTLRMVFVPIAGPADAPGSLEARLEQVFRYGQNDIQPQDCRSVSVGDVIRLDDRRFQVLAAGFRELLAA